VLEWILLSMEKSTCRDYDKDIDDIRRTEKTLEQAIQLFQKTESRVMVKKQQLSRTVVTSEQKNKEVKESANAVQQQSGGGKVCNVCKRIGHLQKDCWKTMTCGHCGVKGHPTERCRLRNAGSGLNDQNSEVNSDENKNKTPLAKMFGVKFDNLKKNAMYSTSSYNLESIQNAHDHINHVSKEISDKIDIVDFIECNCNCTSHELERLPDARLFELIAEFESLMLSDLIKHMPSVFNIGAIIPGVCTVTGIILDSGATNHMFADKSLFKSLMTFSKEERVPIKVADGK